MTPLKFETRTADLGDDVAFCVGYTPTLTLLILNSRPPGELDAEHAQAIPAQRDPVTAHPPVALA